MTNTGRGGGGHGGGGHGGGGHGGGGHGGHGHGHGGWRGRRFYGGPTFYNYSTTNDWWNYVRAAQQQQAYLQYLQYIAAANSASQYEAPGSAQQASQLRVAIERLTQELAGIENALGAAMQRGG